MAAVPGAAQAQQPAGGQQQNVDAVNAAQLASQNQAAQLQAMGENHQRVMSLVAMLAELSKGLQQLWQLIAANMK